MKVKTSELTGAALDWAVAKCEGFEVAFTTNKEVVILREGVTDYFDPHRNWGWGGPIIEREQITSIRRILHDGTPEWWATTKVSDLRTDYDPVGISGPTPLTAAMRCYVASKLGHEVEVPKELT